MIERRHRVEGVRERTKTQADCKHAFGIACGSVSRRADDAVFQKDARSIGSAFDFGRERDHDAGAFAGVDQRFGL